MSAKRGKTDRAELVQTHKIALALTRLQGPPYDGERWKRSLYHALGIVGVGRSVLENIRKALDLP